MRVGKTRKKGCSRYDDAESDTFAFSTSNGIGVCYIHGTSTNSIVDIGCKRRISHNRRESESCAHTRKCQMHEENREKKALICAAIRMR